MLCKVTHCAGRVLANTRPHQLRWGDREMGTAISCTECSQVAGRLAPRKHCLFGMRATEVGRKSWMIEVCLCMCVSVKDTETRTSHASAALGDGDCYCSLESTLESTGSSTCMLLM